MKNDEFQKMSEENEALRKEKDLQDFIKQGNSVWAAKWVQEVVWTVIVLVATGFIGVILKQYVWPLF